MKSWTFEQRVAPRRCSRSPYLITYCVVSARSDHGLIGFLPAPESCALKAFTRSRLISLYRLCDSPHSFASCEQPHVEVCSAGILAPPPDRDSAAASGETGIIITRRPQRVEQMRRRLSDARAHKGSS